MSEKYKRLTELVEQLMDLMRERQNKREPFMSSFADALKGVVDKTREWFNEEVALAKKELEALEGLVPFEDFSSDRSKLTQVVEEFNETAQKLDETVKSVKNGEVKTLKDFSEGGILSFAKPEFIEHITKLYNVSLKLENLIESLEQRARYLTYPLNLMQALARRDS